MIGARDAVAVPDDVDLEGILEDWRAFRRRKHLAEVHWIDALYRAYLTALISGALFLVAAGAAGDGPAHVGSTHDAAARVGVVAATLAFVGARSGSRGGPLALDAAEVRLGLAGPADRIAALRGPALRQLRFLVFASAVAGAAGGNLAARRLDGNGIAWLACGALAAVAATVLAHAIACAVAGSRLPSVVVTPVAAAMVAWSVADVTGHAAFAPFTAVGSIALWPLRFHAGGLVAIAAAAVAVLAALRLVGGTSMERLERRARLVGQIRFAATLQDLRTVIVLRRQLTQERARTRPWLRPPLPSRRLPVLVRDVRSLLRWPTSRLIRLALVAVVAGAAARAAFDGTSPLIVVAGIALFVGGLDAAEPLGQEIDHPTRRDSVPVPVGRIYVWHLPMVAVVCLGLAAAAAAVAVLVDPVAGAWPVAAACVIPAGLAAACGAVVNVLMGAPDPAGGATGAWAVAPPEAAGMRMLFRLVWPPALATFGLLPVLLAREAVVDGRPAVEAAVNGFGPGLSITVLVAGWARYRQDIGRWWSAQMQQAFPNPAARSTSDG